MAQHEGFMKVHEVPQNGTIRKFETGATRDTEGGKNDYEGYLSPLSLFAFGNYMTKHRRQPDGSLRDSDNWQKGISLPCYMKSLWRHLLDLWSLHRGYQVYKERVNGEEVTHVQRGGPAHPDWVEVTVEDSCCGIWFNTQGYLHEHLKQQYEYHDKLTQKDLNTAVAQEKENYRRLRQRIEDDLLRGRE